MTETYPIVAVDTDRREHFTFAVSFDDHYLRHRLPITDMAATKATEDMYDQIPAWHDQQQLAEREVVGELIVTDDGEYIKTRPPTDE